MRDPRSNASAPRRAGTCASRRPSERPNGLAKKYYGSSAGTTLRDSGYVVASEEFVLFHRLDDPASAAVRREIVARGLKSRIDFQNVDSAACEGRFRARRLGCGTKLAFPREWRVVW